MCSIIVGPIMENKDKYQGDLSDIIRASYYGSCSTGTTSSSEVAAPFSHDHHWMFLSDPMDFSSVLEEEDNRGNFGDPFSNTRDPFLHELCMPVSASYLNGSSGSAEIISGSVNMEEAACFGGAGVGSSDACVLAQENIVVVDDMMARPCNIILSNMIQISPKAESLPISTCDSSPVTAKASPKIVKPSAVVSGNMINANTSKDHCLVDNTGVQISSPRNPAAGLNKRRKSQAKKSICIPAPAAPNSRQSGEVVPSDLWAWRKYGQKPIKGSPFPRGYYRCSSSKGCPARKQVERSRTDPNMLVITYTSEHNHPWPTQRNSLAGSSRSQPSKNIINAASKNSETSTQTTEPDKGTTTTKAQEEEQESNSDSNVSPSVVAENSANNASVKEETDGVDKQLEMDDNIGEFSNGVVVPFKNKQLEEYFFSELGEMEADDDDDSLNLFSAQGFINAVDHDHQQRESKGLDPFHVLDWSRDNSTRYHLI